LGLPPQYPDQGRDGKLVGHRLEREQFCQQREDALGIGRIVLWHAVVAIKEISVSETPHSRLRRYDEVDARLASMRGFDLVHQKNKTSDFEFKHALVRDMPAHF
jgi:hypothetical protein